jgi:hypothetical protein
MFAECQLLIFNSNFSATFIFLHVSAVYPQPDFMKTIVSLVLLFMLLNLQSACTKGDDAQIVVDPVLTSNNGPVSLQNSWELRSLYGGYSAPNRNPNYAPGNKNIWKFMDSTYKQYSGGVLRKTGTYTLTKGTSPATGRYMDVMILDRNAGAELFFEFSKDTLVLYRGVIAADGTVEKYVRIPNYQ